MQLQKKKYKSSSRIRTSSKEQIQIQKARITKAKPAWCICTYNLGGQRYQGIRQIVKNKYKYKKQEIQKPNLPGVYLPYWRAALSRDQTNSLGSGAQHACTMGSGLIVTNSYLNSQHFVWGRESNCMLVSFSMMKIYVQDFLLQRLPDVPLRSIEASCCS